MECRAILVLGLCDSNADADADRGRRRKYGDHDDVFDEREFRGDDRSAECKAFERLVEAQCNHERSDLTDVGLAAEGESDDDAVDSNTELEQVGNYTCFPTPVELKLLEIVRKRRQDW